jgi:hypothetical protein
LAAATMARTRNSALYTGKMYSFPLHINRFVLLLLRQRRGAAAATWAPRPSTCENNERRHGHRPRHHGQVPRRTMGAAAGIGLGTTLNGCRRGQRLGATMKYLQRTTSGAAGNVRAKRSSTCDEQ